MAALGDKLRTLEGGRLAFWCPGCHCAHTVRITGTHPWQWNRDADRPTFDPSIVTWFEQDGVQVGRCHSFVRNGEIEFLNDCDHELRGQRVPLPAWPGTALQWNTVRGDPWRG